MHEQVQTLLALGSLPAEDFADPERVARHQQALHAIERPVTDEEARELLKLFGPDGCFGLAWSLLHLIETAPGWPLKDAMTRAHPDGRADFAHVLPMEGLVSLTHNISFERTEYFP